MVTRLPCWGSCSFSRRIVNKWAQHTKKQRSWHTDYKNYKYGVFIYFITYDRVKQPHLTSRQLFPEYNHDWNCDIDFIQQVNKQLQLSHLHFRCNIDCFCSVSAAKIVKQRSQQNHRASHSNLFSHYWMIQHFETNRLTQRFNGQSINICLNHESLSHSNESFERMNQWLAH